MEMRKIFASELGKMMAVDERICIIDADLAKASGTIGLRDTFPDRAFDVGIAEQNMASVAAGLSSYGFIPFITSFGCFASRRICDQLMLSVAYAKQNVKIVGTDPGISAELNGGTHMPFEDIGVLRSIPDMVIFEPVDGVQLRQAMPQIVEHYGPVYIRMFRKELPDIFNKDYKFDLFKADVYKEGSDVSILATGYLMYAAVAAADKLSVMGINAELVNVHTVKPLDSNTILKSIKKTGHVVTAENHNVIGGLYSAVSELAAAEYPVRISRVGIEDEFGQVGKLAQLAEYYRLTADNIVEKVLENLKET